MSDGFLPVRHFAASWKDLVGCAPLEFLRSITAGAYRRYVASGVRIMTYNVRSCRGTDGKLSHERIAEVIATYSPDVVALQELDAGRARTGGRDQAKEIATLVSMETHFHPALRVEQELYGDALLSKHAIKIRKACNLPCPAKKWVDETRGALWAGITKENVQWEVINTHLGLGRFERRQQAAALLGEEWLGAAVQTGNPVVLCGDLNSPIEGGVYRLFRQQLRDAQREHRPRAVQRTFSTTLPVLCLDYIFFAGDVRVVSTEVPRTPLTKVASDHFPLIADLEFRG